MKKLAVLLITSLVIIGFPGCEEKIYKADFEDVEQRTIYDYVVANDSLYSSFLKILKAGGIDKTLSAYNPDRVGYTLFLPSNKAIQEFINNSSLFSSLDELIQDTDYVREFSRYHIVNLGIESNDFPFGALPEYTLSGDLLTVSFVIGIDSSYYKINNQAPVIFPNLEMSNGFIHIIGSALNPITYTSFDWISLHDGFSIFKAAAELTGLDNVMKLNIKDPDNEMTAFTLLLEADSVYQKSGVFSLEDLIQKISPGNSDYTSATNPLYKFVAYHMILDTRFLDDFAEKSTNYITYSEIPLNINGIGLDIKINRGKTIYDTIVVNQDTVVIDYIGFYYDDSNIITQSGAIHYIDRMLKIESPSRAIQTFEFYEEPLFNEFRLEPATYLVEDSSALRVIKYSGTDLFFVESADENHPAWGSDYIYMNGDFIISYKIPKIVQGKYKAFLGADAFDGTNALVEIFIDGKQTGGLIDLTTGGSSNWPFAKIEIGTFNFLKYEQHIVEIRSLIPGRLLWDYIRFEPFNN